MEKVETKVSDNQSEAPSVIDKKEKQTKRQHSTEKKEKSRERSKEKTKDSKTKESRKDRYGVEVDPEIEDLLTNKEEGM